MAADKKLDLYKVHKAEYVTPKKPVLVHVRPARYLTITGEGAPACAEFQNKVGALYSVAFTVKMTRKFAGQDYKVCHLEGLYWTKGKAGEVLSAGPSALNWKLLIRVPEFSKKADVDAAVKTVRAKGKAADAAKVRLETINEGQCVQMLHVGPYSRESETLARMREFAEQKGLSCRGRHHEIYLSDPRRVPAERLRTIIRHPMG